MTSLSAEDEKAQKFLKAYLNNSSPTGHEMKGQDMWMKHVLSYMDSKDDFVTDTYGSVAAVIKGSSSEFKFCLEAHADEINWRINGIGDDGIMWVMRNGGSDAAVAPGTFVNIHAKKKDIPGVFGFAAVHVRHDSDKKESKIEDLRVDVGANSRQEVLDMGIDIGMTLTYDTGFKELNNGKYYACRALDDRICGFSNAEVIRQLKENNIVLPYDLYVVNSVQEETGLRGAGLMAHIIQPDAAIALDVTHDTKTRGYDKFKQGDLACGKGPVLAYGAVLHNKIIEVIENTALEKNIPIQKTATGYSSGTDADAFAYSGKGRPTGLISLALKYMHTPVEMIATRDLKYLTALVYETLQNITGKPEQFDYYADKRPGWKAQLNK